MTDSADLLAKADETRRLADAARTDTIRWQLVGLARQFERLAEQIELGKRACSQQAGSLHDAATASAFMMDVAAS